MFTGVFDAILHWRRNLVEDLAGEVLEIGVGSGSNLGYYRRAAHVWAIEPDAERAEAARRAGVRVQASPDALPFSSCRDEPS